jgi:hypothetical protein
MSITNLPFLLKFSSVLSLFHYHLIGVLVSSRSFNRIPSSHQVASGQWKTKTMKYYDTFRLLRALTIMHGKFDQESLKTSEFRRFLSNFVRILMLSMIVKHYLAAYFMHSVRYSFYLGNMTYAQGYMLSFCHMLTVATYMVWASYNFHLFRQCNYVTKYQFWLKLLPHDPKEGGFSSLPIYCLNQKTRNDLRLFFANTCRFIFPLVTVNSFVVVNLMIIYYYYSFRSLLDQLNPFVFWSILILNQMKIWFCGVHAFTITIGLSFYFVYISYVFRLQLKTINRNFELMSRSMQPINVIKLYRLIRAINLILSNFARANYFWNRVLGVNYLGSSVTISFLTVQVYFSTSLFIQISFTCLIVALHIFSLSLPLWSAGKLNHIVIINCLLIFLFV